MMLGGSPIRVAVPPTLEAKGLREQQGHRVDLQGQRNFNGHRNHQQHGGDIVQKRRSNCGDRHEDGGKDEDVAPRRLKGLIGHPLEHPGLFQDADESSSWP